MLRTYGRKEVNGVREWVEVTTTPDGYDDLVWATTLVQCLLLNLGESPFYSNYGIPAHPSVVQQVAPDFYVARTQVQFSQYFASLIIAKQQSTPEPMYRVAITTHQGLKLSAGIPIPV